jgi:hypothetical protein
LLNYIEHRDTEKGRYPPHSVIAGTRNLLYNHRTNHNRVLNPVMVTRDCDVPPPPPPDPLHKRGRAERRGAVVGDTGSHLIILNSSFLTLNFLTHPLPPLKRGGLSIEAQFVGIPAVIS